VDELSLGLAPLVVKNIYKTLKQISVSRKMTVVVVEQNVRLALEIGTGLIFSRTDGYPGKEKEAIS